MTNNNNDRDNNNTKSDKNGNIKHCDSSNIHDKITKWASSLQNKLSPTQQLLTDPAVAKRAVQVLHFAVVCDAANAQLLGPNYALMVLPNGHPDSFPSTKPFGFAAASYFIPFTANLGTAIASTLVGSLSDRVGRRVPILVSCFFSGLLSIGKYFARRSYWAFNAVNFVNGLFSGTAALAMAYVSDLYQDQKKKDKEIGLIIAFNMIGRSGGGVFTIIFSSSQGLFAPLWVAAAFMVVAALLCYMFLIETNQGSSLDETLLSLDVDLLEQEKLLQTKSKGSNNNGKDVQEIKIQENENNLEVIDVDNVNNNNKNDEINNNINEKNEPIKDKKIDDDDCPDNSSSSDDVMYIPTLCIIVFGSLLDNFGSNGLIPIGLNPLMFTTYYADFVVNGQEPIMSAEAYKWIYVFVAVIVVPGAVISPLLFQKLGAPLSCILANILTGCMIITLLYISLINPPTTGTFIAFVSVLYASFPFTVVSQLSTGPMLDRISPDNRRGFIQGLNNTITNLGAAIAPFLFGALIDLQGIKTCMWTTVGISFFAAVVNSPLLFHPLLQPAPGKTTANNRSDDDAFGKNYNQDNDDINEENIGTTTTNANNTMVPLLSEEEIAEKARKGEWVPASQVAACNEFRMQRSEPAILTHFGKYSNDEFLQHHWSHEEIKSEYRAIRDILSSYVAATDTKEGRIAVAEQFNKTFADLDPVEFAQVKQELGEWVADYLIENGYQLGQSSALFKHMVRSAFPSIGNKVRTPENVRERLLRYIKVLNSYIELEDTWETKTYEVLGGQRRTSILAI